MKIPPHPTQFQVLQQSKDLTYSKKNYLRFQIHPGLLKEIVQLQWDSKAKYFPHREGSNRSIFLSLPEESCLSTEKFLEVTNQAGWQKISAGEAQGSEEIFQIPARRALVIAVLFIPSADLL